MPDTNPNPQWYGMPSRKTLEGYRIWDSYFTPSFSSTGSNNSRLFDDIDRTLPTIEKARIERLCIFPYVGSGATNTRLRANPKDVLRPFERWPKLLMGMIQLNAADVKGSLDNLNRWLRDGPMLGVYFPAGPRPEQVCSHPNFDPLVERIAELNGVIMQHTWFITDGKRSPGMSTPTELGQLAARHPDIKFVCAHAGGEWAKGIRAVRKFPNILVETSGFDATAGFIEMAVRELGAERIIFGSHLPSRSLGAELSKVIHARITGRQKFLILGENYRKLLAPIFRKNGLK